MAETAAPKKTTTRKSTRSGGNKSTSRKTTAKTKASASFSTDQRESMIREAAYYRAESRGFCSDPQQDWLEAEEEIDRQLAGA